MPAYSRLSRLALVLALFALPTFTLAQTAIQTKDTVLFDFEAGNFDGWTLTGDCWDKTPATPQTFTDKQGNSAVSGIVGSGYLTTLYKNAATTGKAVSKDFTIDKPFLTFKIGGGRYPKEACINLLIDGKIVRTETGTDSATLVPAYWDVYAFIGKTAHLEIVDATASQSRGYIMLDDLRLSERPPMRFSDLKINSGYGDGVDKVLGFFFKTIPENVTLSTIDSIPIGLNEYLATLDKISLAMIGKELDHRPNLSIPMLAKRIKTAIDQTITRSSVRNSEELKERFYAHGITDWVRTHIYYDKRLLLAMGDPNQAKLLKDTHDPTTLLCYQQPGTTCGGFALLIRDIASDPCFGIKCEYVAGYLRSPDGRVASQRDHGWAVFTFKDGTVIPADASASRIGIEDARKLQGHIKSYFAMPVTPTEWSVFAAIHFAECNDKPVLFGDKQNKHHFSSLTLTEWTNVNASILEGFQRKRLSMLGGATIN